MPTDQDLETPSRGPDPEMALGTVLVLKTAMIHMTLTTHTILINPTPLTDQTAEGITSCLLLLRIRVQSKSETTMLGGKPNLLPKRDTTEWIYSTSLSMRGFKQ